MTHTTQKMSIKDLAELVSNYLGFKRNYINSQMMTSDMTEPGIYYSTGFYISGKPANIKNEYNLTIMVLQDSSGNKVQVFIADDNVIWVRRWKNNAYTSWQRVD